MLNRQEVGWILLRLQFQAELLLQRSEYGRSGGINRIGENRDLSWLTR